MVHLDVCQSVLRAFPAARHSQRIEPLGGAGGFSGAQFWRVKTEQAVLALRCWPRPHPTPQRLRFLHALLRHVYEQGVRCVPVPLRTAMGESWVECAGHLWDLTPWLPGTAAEAQRPEPLRLQAAMATLAEFHQAAASFPEFSRQTGPSPGLAARREQLDRLLREGTEQLQAALAPEVWPEGVPLAQRIVQLFPLTAPAISRQLHRASELRGPIQICLRDVWREHVLFTGNQVSGLIDFGAARPETPAADVARLLGSLAGDETWAWEQGLRAYEEVRSLSTVERELIPIFDRTTVLLAGLNWIEWIFVERRQFSDRAPIARRLEHFAERLARLPGKLL